jgi:hypothetical protein
MAEIDRKQMINTIACETNAPHHYGISVKRVSTGWGICSREVPN